MTSSDSRPLTEAVTCPVCEGCDYTVLREAKYPIGLQPSHLLQHYRSSSDQMLMDQLVTCKTCSLVYLNPRIRGDLILKSYSDAIDPTFVRQNEQRIKTFSRTLRRIIKRHKVQPDADKRVLDIGCAGGAFPKAAANLGFSVIGIEPSQWLCEYGRKEYNLDLRAGVLQDYTFPDDHFSMVTLWDVIEHLAEPLDALKAIRPILREDGLLLVNFPNYSSLARKFFGHRWPFFLSVHLFYFTPETISKLLSKAGFEVLSLETFWQTLELGYICQRASAYIPAMKALRKPLELSHLNKMGCSYNLGQSLLIARKLAQ